MEELVHQLTSSPISGKRLTSPSLLVDADEAVDEIKALTNLDSLNVEVQLATSARPSLAMFEAGAVNDVEGQQQPDTSSALAAVGEVVAVNDVEGQQQPGTSSALAAVGEVVAVNGVEVHPQQHSSTSHLPISDAEEMQNLDRKSVARKRKRNADQWKCNVRKAKRAKGEAYVNTVGMSVPAKEVLPLNCKCRFKCSEAFSDDVRNKICAEYYALGDFCRQKDYILQRLIVRPVKTRRIVSREVSGDEAFHTTGNCL